MVGMRKGAAVGCLKSRCALARSACWFCALRRVAAGMMQPSASCATSSVSATSAWARRWWGMLAAAVQQAVGGAALGRAQLASVAANRADPELDELLRPADAETPSRLPLRH